MAPSTPSKKAKAIAHSKKKWDDELAEWQTMCDQLFEMQHQLHRQKERVHKAYLAHIQLVGHP